MPNQNPNPASTCFNSPFLGLTPFEFPDVQLAKALLRARVPAVLDLGRVPANWSAAVQAAESLSAVLKAVPAPAALGLRVPEGGAVPEALALPGSVSFLVLGHGAQVPKAWQGLPVVVQVSSVEAAEQALAQGASGLIAKGQEAGGPVGYESAFVLLQRILKLKARGNTLVWCQGGMGLYTAPAVFASGATGVVFDAALAALPESSLPEAIKSKLATLDGSEIRCVAGDVNVFGGNQRDAAKLDSLDAATVAARLASTGDDRLWALGQDAALAASVAKRYSAVGEFIAAMRLSIRAQVRQARQLKVLEPGNAWAQSHGVAYPVAQGPMTRVSDTPEFAQAVAREGAMPFLALSLLNRDTCRTLLEGTVAAVGDRPWGVGVLGFAAPEVLEPQLELLQEFSPSVLLIAGGRPAQAKAFEARGIPAYLHVPSPGLLDIFLKEGATHFVFEGRECGGHVGPRFSFVLWEQAVVRLLAQDDLSAVHVLFAGGIHDAVSAAMVAVIAAPLVARGAKVGVLMGTAYIATVEAVQGGAVLEEFQRQTLGGAQTALIETAPGHAIRCLPSGFIDLFNREKSRLNAEGVDTKEAWQKLESLTVGRLRVATKGQDRVNGEIVDIPLHTQLSEGMYMIGQVVAMQDRVLTMAELHSRVTSSAVAHLETLPEPAELDADVPEPIAIVGMSAIYPGSPDLESYWANILGSRDLVSEVPADRWSVQQYYSGGAAERDKSVSKWGGFLEPMAFDPLEFGIPPATLASVEPVQLLSLKAAKDALADAGYATKWFNREKTSVIFGAEAGMDLGNQYTFRNLWQQYAGDIPPALDAALPALTEDSFPGMLVNVISGRIANRLGLGGVNYAVTSACASSLTAIELAVKELRNGTSDMALAGGADFHNGISDYLMFSSVGALSVKGRCRSFDAEADGIALGEGIGVVVLKRLSDATADGDRIYAVIDGIAGSSDGKGLGLTAPRKEGQKRALERAYSQANVLPGEVGLVEAHGTGTVVGDRTELQTLTEVFTAGGAVPAQAVLGSVKSQIGHTKCAAGIAGLIKITKALHHRVLPGTLHVSQPNPGYRAASSPFRFTEQPLPWVGKPGQRTRAAVSAFGFGGANFHAVLSAWEGDAPAFGAVDFPAELVLLRGHSLDEARAQARTLHDWLNKTPVPAKLRDLAATVWRTGQGPVQFAFVAESVNGLANTLEGILANRPDVNVFQAKGTRACKVAALFSGQGSQHPGMLRDLFVYFPALQSDLQAEPELAALMFPPKALSESQQAAQQAAITDTRAAQPALGLAGTALFRWLSALGLKPAMAAGHSYGELVALSTAGVFSTADLIALSKARARCILDSVGDDPGYMAAVSTNTDTLGPLLAGFDGVVMANQNSPVQVVISGPTASMDAALAHLKAQGLAAKPIATAAAFHSPQLKAASDAFLSALQAVEVHAPTHAVSSNLTAELYPSQPDDIRQALAEQISNPVRWVDQVRTMAQAGADLFVEIGPKKVLAGLANKILGDAAQPVLAIDQGEGSLKGLLKGVAQLATLMEGFDASVLFDGRAQTVSLSEVPKLPASVWWVDGGKAVPGQAGSLKVVPPVTAPVVSVGGSASPAGQPVVVQATPAHADVPTSAVFSYLNNMRELVTAQRDVLVSYLGVNPTPMATTAPALPFAPAAQRVSAPTAAPASVPVAASAQAVMPAVSNREVLLQLVSDRTGYPVETLDLDLDLEADLSIDSIKRVEITGELSDTLNLRTALGANAAAQLDKLGQKRTLRQIIDFLDEVLPSTPAAAPVAQAAPEPATPAASPAVQADRLLLDIIANCTGYPVEALDVTLDLEADLSIDSIKRIEIVGQWLDSLGATAGSAQRSALSEALSKCRSIADMVACHASHAPNDTSAPVAVAPAEEANDDAIGDDIPFERYVMRTRSIEEAATRLNIQGKNVVLIPDSLGVAPVVAEQLKALGAKARVICFRSEREALNQALEHTDALIHLWGIDPASRMDDTRAFFEVARTAVLNGTSHLLVVTALGLDEHQLVRQPERGAGLAGLVKSLAREFPQLNVRTLDVDVDQFPAEVAQSVVQEFSSDDRYNEVVRRGAARYTVEAVASPLDLSALKGLALNEQSVVLLTGGAKGITALVAMELARRHRCTLELVGRSAEPVGAESALTRHETDPKRLRQLVLQNSPGKKPAEVEREVKRLLAEREHRKTIETIEAAGGRVRYHALDVQDASALEGLIAQLYAEHGRIDGVVHGAGVIEDKLLKDKTSESFARVFNTKVIAANTLRKAIRDDVGFVVFFSSVASAFGNRGQVDYASANDALDKLARAWQADIAGRVLSVNWGPWADTGMVNESLRKEYASKNIGLVPKVGGVAALLDELASPVLEAQVVLMSGKPESFIGTAAFTGA